MCFNLTKLNNPNKRCKFLSEKKINKCRNCMRGAHMMADCRQGPNCTLCHQRNHMLLHTNSPVVVNKASQERRPLESALMPNQMAAASINTQNSHPILQSWLAWLLSHSGETLQVRVFLDSGCEKSGIWRDVAHWLGLDGPTEDLCLVGIGGKALPPTKEKMVKFRLRSRDGKYTTQQMNACTTEKITNPLRMVDVDPKNFWHLNDLPFADEYPWGEAQVDILIVVNVYDILLCRDVVHRKLQEPVALQTKLGYVFSRVSEWQSLELTASLAHDQLLEALPEFQQLWKLEFIGIQPEQNSNLIKCEFEAQMCQDKMTHYDQKSKTSPVCYSKKTLQRWDWTSSKLWAFCKKWKLPQSKSREWYKSIPLSTSSSKKTSLKKSSRKKNLNRCTTSQDMPCSKKIAPQTRELCSTCLLLRKQATP